MEETFWGWVTTTQNLSKYKPNTPPPPWIELVNLTLSGSNNLWLSYAGQSGKTGMASVADDVLFLIWEQA